MNNTITEMKNTLEGISSRIAEAEEQISDLEDRMVEFTAVENKEKRMKRNEGQRNTQQMKEQGRNPPDQTNEEEIGSLQEEQFRAMIVKMI